MCPMVRSMQSYSFQLELPSDTRHAAAYNAGRRYIEKTLNLLQYADYMWHGSVIIPTKPSWSTFNYSYKAWRLRAQI